MTSAAPTIKAALVAELQALYAAPVVVSYGHPGADVEDDMVAVMDIRSTQEVATLSPMRKREETLDVDVVISCFRGGGPEAQQVATERAYALLALLESWVQGDGYTIGGTVRLGLLSRYDLAEATDPDILALGRVAEITATLTCSVRI